MLFRSRPPRSFVRGSPKIRSLRLPAVYKEIAFDLFVDTLNVHVYSDRKGRIWQQQERCPSKIPIQSARDIMESPYQISKHKAVALDNFTYDDPDGAAEHRAVANEGMEFTVLAAGINAFGHGIDEVAVKKSTCPLARCLLGVDASDIRAKAACHHLLRKCARR